jgi:hypothetical protein
VATNLRPIGRSAAKDLGKLLLRQRIDRVAFVDKHRDTIHSQHNFAPRREHVTQPGHRALPGLLWGNPAGGHANVTLAAGQIFKSCFGTMSLDFEGQRFGGLVR